MTYRLACLPLILQLPCAFVLTQMLALVLSAEPAVALSLGCLDGSVSTFRLATFESNFATGCGSDLVATVSDAASPEDSTYFFRAEASPDNAGSPAPAASIVQTGKISLADESAPITNNASLSLSFTTGGVLGELVMAAVFVQSVLSYTTDLGSPVDDPTFLDRENRSVEIRTQAGVLVVDVLDELDLSDAILDLSPQSGTVSVLLAAQTTYELFLSNDVNFQKQGELLRSTSVQIQQVPEPSTGLLLAIGLFGLTLRRHKNRQQV